MTVIYAACVCNPDYAGMLGVNPAMTQENLKVLAIDEAALDASVFDSNMYAMLGCATGAKRNTPEAVGIINAKNFICDTFIPSWINASNEPNDESGYFITEGRGLKKSWMRSVYPMIWSSSLAQSCLTVIWTKWIMSHMPKKPLRG